MNIPYVITIDGPAGAGKSTLGKLLAQRLGYLYFDTGVMYRALALVALEQEMDLHNGDLLARLARQLDIQINKPHVLDGRQYTVLVDGRDVTWDLRRADVEQHVSLVASHPAVRTVMRGRQREVGLSGHVVMVGRDIGKVVMPDAPLKIYLETSLPERARRRTNELRARGNPAHSTDVQKEVARRDALDRHVMAPASDALLLQGDGLSPEEEVDAIMAYLADFQPSGGRRE